MFKKPLNLVHHMLFLLMSHETAVGFTHTYFTYIHVYIGGECSLQGDTCVVDKFINRKFLNFTPLFRSCWYSSPVEDGVL
jgi:hypothetical protein